MSLQDSHQIGNVRIMLVKGTDGAEIVSVEKTGTTGLVDTYTITLSNDQKYTFTVTNGKSIVSIEKTATVGLVDTYTITYNDGSTDTFDVTNGKDMEPDVSAIVNVYSSKNLLENLLTTQSTGGCILTVNADKSITVTNNATSEGVGVWINASFSLPKGSYILSGVPEGGGANKYRVEFYDSNYATLAVDSGNGAEFTLNSDENNVKVALYISEGYGDGLTFKPMLRDARISDDTYAPYAKTNKELTEDTISKTITATENTTYVTANQMLVNKTNKIVTFVGHFTITSVSYGVKLFTLSEREKSGQIPYLIAINSANNIAFLKVNNGDILVESATGITAGSYAIVGSFEVQ